MKVPFPIILALLLLRLSPHSVAQEASPPVRVFILAGQSNMEGMGQIEAKSGRNDGRGSLEYLVKNAATAKQFSTLVDDVGAWRVRDDVWISYLDRKGRLTVGYGARRDTIGPELGFGWVMGDALGEPVLLIKCAWGGKSLAVDFRPPSAGKPPYSLGEKTDAAVAENPEIVGRYYRETLALTKAALANIRQLVPGSDGRYILSGIGWHQGWNDRINDKFNAEYESNLAHFIRDIRTDLGAPALPFVIAETGMAGPSETHPRALSLMRAQAAVAEHAEFKGNVAFVGTKAFWRPQEYSPSGQGYHWNSNAETYYLMGEAMGEAMKQLLKTADAALDARLQLNFDPDWRFHLGDVENAESADFNDSAWRRIDVPHDFNREGAFSPTNASSTAFLPGGIGWYRKAFLAPEAWQARQVHIEFDGVAMNSQVWINGEFLGKRPYAYSSFNYDLTPHIRPNATNVIAVRVDHSVAADSRWYVGSGVYRHVWLVVTGPVHLARHGVFFATPEVTRERARVNVETQVQNESDTGEELELMTELFAPDGRSVGRVSSRTNLIARSAAEFHQEVEVATPALWSPDSPALYRAVSTVRRAGETVDRLETSFGIRSIRFTAQEGFSLNGKPTKFKGICLHHDGGVVGAAVPEKVLERRLRMAKGIGCNAIRTSHNPMAPEFYALCDRLGLLVMDEAFDEWNLPKRKWVEGWNRGRPALHGSAEFFDEWSDADLREMVMRDRNHPCIVLWSIGNEIDYPNDPFSHPADGRSYDPNKPSAEILAKTGARLTGIVHQLDPTRPVTMALANLRVSNVTGLADLLDVVGYNYQADQYAKDLENYPNRKFVGSETGQGPDFLEISKEPRVAGQFLWVGFDFLGEGGAWPSRGSRAGVFDTCGFLKTRGYQRAAWWSEQPVIHVAASRARAGRPGGRRFGGFMESHWNWQDNPQSELTVAAFSNCETVELFLNGKSLGAKTSSEAANGVFRWNVTFEPGKLKAVGTRDGRTVEQDLVTAGEPARVQLIPDQTKLAADGSDVSQIELRLVDSEGVLVPHADTLCSIEVGGAGRLLGLDNGNQRDVTALTASSRRLNQGRALAIVQSRRYPGSVQVTVKAEGLPETTLELQAQ